MIVGVPKEVKDREYRVGMTPGNVSELIRAGHTVLVETHAGEGSGFSDQQYEEVGAKIVPTHSDAYNQAEMVVKVKEPIESEYSLLRDGLLLFTYLHLAPEPALTKALVDSKTIAVAYETVELANGSLPLLQPMSSIAGRMAVQVGAHYLEKTQGGEGVLLGGVPGVLPANVVVVGGGVVGTNAAQMALGMGAAVTILDIDVDRLTYLSEVLPGRLFTLKSSNYNLSQVTRDADLVVGGVLIHGAKAPKLVTHQMISNMKPGSVVVDVAIDQGGCIETCKPTSHSDPVFIVDGVIHYCVTNMPGALARTSTFALTNATQSYTLALANYGFEKAVRRDPALAKGVNAYKGKITYEAVADAFGTQYTSLESLLS
jgi:alanine dehydrogenase